MLIKLTARLTILVLIISAGACAPIPPAPDRNLPPVIDGNLPPGGKKNLPPVIDRFTVEPLPANIGQPLTFTFKAHDPNIERIFCTLDPGDGSRPYLIGSCFSRLPIERTHTYDRRGTYTAILTATDLHGASTTAELSVHVVPVINTGPFARSDVAETDEDRQKRIEVLANDRPGISRAAIDPGTLRIIERPDNGSVTVTIHGEAYYRPNQDYNGEDSFTYRVKDINGNESNEASVTVVVNAVNDPPVINWLSALHAPGADNVIGFFWDVSDVDDTTLTCTVDPGDSSPVNTITNCSENDSQFHVYTTGGRFTAVFHVNDTQGGEASAVREINITPEGNLEWRYQIGQTVFSAPAIEGPVLGNLYVGSANSYVYALTASGNLIWRFQTEGPVYSSAAIDDDGTVYIGSDDHKFYAINPDGSEKWHYSTLAKVRAAPALGADGSIYITGEYLNAIHPDGSRKWRYGSPQLAGPLSSPAVADDGTIFFVSLFSGELHAVNPDGSAKWGEPVIIADKPHPLANSPHHFTPAIGADGTIYVGSWDGYLYAINPDSTVKWRHGIASNLKWTSVAIDKDGTIYSGSGGRLYALNPDGSEKWHTVYFPSPACTPTIGSNGTIYVGSSEGYLYAINPDGSQRWRYGSGGDFGYHCPNINGDGKVHIGSTDGYLYTVRSFSIRPGLADSPWPNYRHDRWNTGRAE